jgi:D-amino-acid dehydrogenase
MPDVVVIGGGVVGSAAAYAAATAGARVCLVDARLPGRASAAGAGIVSAIPPSVMPDGWYPIAFRAVAHYDELAGQLAADGVPASGQRRVGALVIAMDDGERSQLAALGDRALALTGRYGSGPVGQIREVDDRELSARKPWLAPGMSAVEVPGARRVDGRALVRDLRRGLRRHGGRIVAGWGSVVAADSAVRGVAVGGRTIGADLVINATGAWAGRPCGDAGVLPVRPVRGQLVHIQVPDATDQSIVSTFRSHYAVTFPEGRVVVGASSEPDAGFAVQPTAGAIRQVLDRAIELGPALDRSRVLDVRVGLRPVSVDGWAVLGPDPLVDRLYHAGGLGQWGLTMGPYLGRECALLALGGPRHPDLEVLRADRFAPAGTGETPSGATG